MRTMINGLAAMLEATAAAGNQQVADAKQRIDGFTSAMNAAAVSLHRQAGLDGSGKQGARRVHHAIRQR